MAKQFRPDLRRHARSSIGPRPSPVGRVALARAGTGLAADPRNFAVVLFDPKTQLYDGFELADPLGKRYLIRKIEDIAAHVAPLDEIRDEVIRAWKRDRARPLARKAADELAAKIKQQGAQIKDLSIENRPVIAVDSVHQAQARDAPSHPRSMASFGLIAGRRPPTDLVEIRMAGQTLLDSLFALKPGEVSVEADQPRENYYILTLDKRDPVPFLALMGPNGAHASYKRETQEEAFRKAYGEGMARLRDQAGYRPQDYPTRGAGSRSWSSGLMLVPTELARWTMDDDRWTMIDEGGSKDLIVRRPELLGGRTVSLGTLPLPGRWDC